MLGTAIDVKKAWGGYSHRLTIWVCAAGQGMVFRPLGLEQGI